jgi:hypothetical protein
LETEINYNYLQIELKFHNLDFFLILGLFSIKTFNVIHS